VSERDRQSVCVREKKLVCARVCVCMCGVYVCLPAKFDTVHPSCVCESGVYVCKREKDNACVRERGRGE